jgi:hypothetical protein
MVDLHSRGYVSEPYKVHGAYRAIRQIAFGGTDELVVINDGGMCGKSNPVHAFVLNSKSGKLMNEAKWASNCWPYIFATAKGNYAAVTDNGMSVYSPGLKNVVATAPQTAAEMASPDGRVLAAWRQIPHHGQTYLLNADTLQTTNHEILDRNVVSVSPDTFAYLVTRAGSPDQIVLLDNGGPKLPEITTYCSLAHVRFLSADKLAVLGCNRLRVLNTQGSELFADGNTGYIGGSEIGAVSRDGSRFALTRIYDDSGDVARVCAERITVFDVAGRKPIFALDLGELSGFDAHGHASGVALSPDGSLLAVDSEGIIQVFQMPNNP